MSIRKKGMRMLSILLSACMIQNMTLPALANQQTAVAETEIVTKEVVATDSDAIAAVAANALAEAVVSCEVTGEIEWSLDEDLLKDLPENDELLTGYFEQELYDIPSGGISMFGTLGTSMLKKDVSKKLYSILKANVQDIAAGKTDSAECTISQNELGMADQTWTKEELENIELLSGREVTSEAKSAVGAKLQDTYLAEAETIINYLLIDCPYDLYWYDKTDTGNSKISYGYSISASNSEITISDVKIYIYLGVSADYASSGTIGSYKVNTDKTKVVATAAANAKTIVSNHVKENDYTKLKSYLEEICSLVSYDSKTLSDPPAYGNPWQVIYVFDGDPQTNVVCEGYAKAFQYLCDLSEFNSSEIVCYSVSGNVTAGNGDEKHMWNIVTMKDGKNYLVDVTNCDSEAIESPDKLFLAGTSGSVSAGYEFTLDSSNSIKYTYDTTQKSLFGESILTLAGSNYVETADDLQIVEKNGTIAYGDCFTLETDGGNNKTITWSSSDNTIASVDSKGVVTVNGVGTVVITATEEGTGKSDEYQFTAEKKILTVENITVNAKKYDGTTAGSVQSVVFDGLVNGENLTVGTDFTAKAVYEQANAGEAQSVNVNVTLNSTKVAKHYNLANGVISLKAAVEKAPLTVKADNVSMKTGAAKPSFTATVTGLVGAETMTGIQFTDTATDTTKAGKYVITPSGGTISSGNANYNITYETGTLTIVLDSAKMDAALESAETAKTGISVSNEAASKVSKGTKFVTTEVMKALEAAIANAEAVLENATTMAEINNAAAELEQAVAVFQSAIKVGTKKDSSGGGGGGGGGGSSSGGGGGGSSSGTKTSTAWSVTIDTATNMSGAWVQDANGWWFRYSNGAWPAAKWVELSKNGVKTWYSFNAAGYMETGWKLDGNCWYYLNPTTGEMVTGWVQVNGIWYYLNPVSGTKPLGAMYCNEMTPDGYFVDASGAWR